MWRGGPGNPFFWSDMPPISSWGGTLMSPLPILIKVCIQVLGIYNRKAFKYSSAPLRFALQVVAKLLCSCLCLFHAIIALHPLNEKKFIDFLKVKLK